MKNYTLLLLTFIVLYNCNDNLGSLPFEEKQENTFSIYMPEHGDFEFKQKYSTSLNSKKVATSIRILSNDSITAKTKIEILAFKNDILKFSNLVFNFRETLYKNKTNYIHIDSISNTLLTSNQVKIAVLEGLQNPTHISGHYEGICKITTIETDSLLNQSVLFKIYGNIDIDNNLLLFPKNPDINIDYISGTYNESYEFTGSINKDNLKTGTVVNDKTNFEHDTINNMLTDNLKISTNTNVTKILDLTIQKID